MKHENEFGVRLNQFGGTDVDYYVANARQMRSQAISGLFQDLKTWLTRLLDRTLSGHQGPGAAPSH